MAKYRIYYLAIFKKITFSFKDDDKALFGSITEQERNGMETQLHKRATYLNFKIN